MAGALTRMLGRTATGGVQPTFLSATGYTGPASDATSWTPFTGLDISNCQMAVFVCSVDSNPTLSTASSGWNALASNAGLSVTQRVFYKVSPTASETLAIAASVGSQQFSGVLIRILNGANISGTFSNSGNTAAADIDPPSHNAGASRPHLWIACGSWDGVVVASVEPSGFINLSSAASSGANGAGTSIATREETIQTKDPGVFTSASEQYGVGTLAVWA